MGKFTYLKSTARGVLISAYATVTKKVGIFALCNLDKSIVNLFDITKMTFVFPIYTNLEEAIKSF